MTSIAIDKARAIAWDYAASQRAGDAAAMMSALDRHVSPQATWQISHPLNAMIGRDALKARFWKPLLHSFQRLERRDDIFLAGAFRDKVWVASTGYFIGTFSQPWLDIQPTDQAAFIRFGEILEVEGDQIANGYLLLDIVSVAQSGRR